jgi:hypothetical protein
MLIATTPNRLHRGIPPTTSKISDAGDRLLG